jgi:hypothetical protein
MVIAKFNVQSGGDNAKRSGEVFTPVSFVAGLYSF